MATQTQAHFMKFFGMWDLLPNDTLIARVHQHMSAVGLRFSESEQAFAKACQREMNLPELGLATSILPILGELKSGGSTPVGDVSYNTPMAYLAGRLCRWSGPSHLGSHCVRRNVDRGQRSFGQRAHYGWCRIRLDDRRRSTQESASRLPYRRGDTVYVSPLPQIACGQTVYPTLS